MVRPMYTAHFRQGKQEERLLSACLLTASAEMRVETDQGLVGPAIINESFSWWYVYCLLSLY
jgi:hypothetical protein